MGLISRGTRKRLGLVFWIVSVSVTFVVCCRVLWLAYITHWIFMPSRRGGRFVLLEQEPGLFWAAVAIYALVVLCAPVGVATLISDLVGALRTHRRSQLRQRD